MWTWTNRAIARTAGIGVIASDFLVVRPRGESGLAPAIVESNSDVLKNALGKQGHDHVKQGSVQGATEACAAGPRRGGFHSPRRIVVSA